MEIVVSSNVVCDGFSQLAEVKALLEASRRTVVIAHQNADGDAVGSLTACYALLCAHTGATVTAMLPDGVPDELAWLPHTDAVLDGKRDNEACVSALQEADVVLGTDFNVPSRVDNLSPALTASQARKILIDHHHEPDTKSFDIVLSMPSISSACELVYWTMRALWGREAMTPDVATSLYAGLRTDTGGMAFSNSQPSLYLAAAELVQCGIDPAAINQQINNVFTPERLMFYGYAFSRLLTVYPAQRLALMVIHRADMEAYGVASSDLTGLINEVMRLRDTECAVLIREEVGRVRLSFRSKTTTDVNRIARELFTEGGGHIHAAGATSRLSLDETVATVKRKFDIND